MRDLRLDEDWKLVIEYLFMLFFKKLFKIIFYTVILVGFFILVDFRDFSFKTIVPGEEASIEIVENSETGVIRSLEDFEDEREAEFVGENQDIIDLVNEARTAEGLGTVKENFRLKLSAMEKAEHMRDNDYFEHISPSGLNPWYFAQKQNYEYRSFGENLALGYFSAKSVHEGWMNSPGHRANILSENFEEIGVAILEFQQDGRKSYLIVQHFGTQLKPADLVTEIVCDKKSKKNCEEAEDEEERIEDLVEQQEKIIKEAKKDGVSAKELNRLEENLEDLEEAEEEMEDYLEECEDFIKKCDKFK